MQCRRCAPSGRSRRSRPTTSLRSFFVRHRVRRLAAVATRHRAQQPGRLGGHDGGGAPPERRHGLATADPRRGHGARVHGGARGAARADPRRGLQHRRPEANYLIHDLALMVADVVAGAEVTFAQGAGTDPRSYKVDSRRFGRSCPAFACRWDAGAAPRSLRPRTGPRRWTTTLHGRQVHAPVAPLRSLLATTGLTATRSARALDGSRGSVIFTPHRLRLHQGRASAKAPARTHAGSRVAGDP